MAVSGSLAQLAALLLPAAAVVTALFAAYAPDPYMDEPFHVPQTHRYCQGRWLEWDPKITTFPGLYLFGTAMGRLLHAAQQALGTPQAELCSTTALRSVNLLFAAACLPLCYHAARRLDPSRTQQQLLLMTAACFLYPLHFFFTFLYYTDVPSLFFTLATYLAAQYHWYRLAGVLGALAVLMRQTNAVWVAFTLATAVLDRCLGLPGSKERGGSGNNGGSSRQQMQQGSSRGRIIQQQQGDSSSAQEVQQVGSSTAKEAQQAAAAPLLSELAVLLRRAWALKWQLLADLWPLAAVVAAFAAFVVINGSIVVGDHTHHMPVRHLAQPLYCLLYCTAWLAPAFWSPAELAATARRTVYGLRRRPSATLGSTAAVAALAVAAIHRGTLIHPFLLADNRHYTFYLWRRLLNRTPWARYALLPAYLHAVAAVAAALRHRRPLWRLLLVGATAAVLVPAHLVEFRYFTVPFYLLFLHMHTPSLRQLGTILAMFAAVNAATLYLFLARPFTWPDGSVARFIW